MNSITMTVFVYVATAGVQPEDDMLVDEVDLIEINHCYDENGQLVFDQLLFYDWSADKGHYDVRDWRLLKSPIQVPRRSHETGGYVALWRDGNTMRRVHAKTVRETWTQYDPEIIEQEYLPKDKRRSLPKLALRRALPTQSASRGVAVARTPVDAGTVHERGSTVVR